MLLKGAVNEDISRLSVNDARHDHTPSDETLTLDFTVYV